jgi:hypothetical protein
MKRITLTRENQTITIQLRQLAHDIPAIVGRRMKYGSGKQWTIIKVEAAG